MKISKIECGNASSAATTSQEKILPKDRPRKHAADKVAYTQLTPLEQGIVVAEQALQNIPDVRENLIEDLRNRIKNGDYHVSGEDVAEMMMRRREADRIR